ncbi:MAG: ABC transporter substrate-binding protein [Armatimonadota bacterium]
MRYWPLMLLAVLPATLFSGCGKKAATGTTVKFLAMEYDTNTRPFMDKVKQQFEAANPDIKLDIEVVDWNLGKDKLANQVAAGQAPDLANVATIWVPEYVQLDVLEPLDGYLSAEMRDRFIPLTLHGAEYQGKLYGLPIAVSARAMYYNKDLLDAAGVKPPTNWDELVTVAKKVTDPTKGIYGFGVQGSKVETDVYYYYFLWANKGEILNAEGTQAAFNSPEGVEALQYMVDLVHKEKVTEPEPTAYDREGLQEMFKSGKLAMTITGPWFWKMLKKDVPDLHYGVAPIPGNEQQKTMAVTDNLIMFKTSPNKEAAWKFVEFFYKPELRQEWAETFGMIPELKSVANSDFIKQSPEWTTFLGLLDSGVFVPLHPRWTAIAKEIEVGVQEALLKQKTPKAALDAAKVRVDALLKAQSEAQPAS